MEKTKKKFFSLDEVKELTEKAKQLKDAGPRARMEALDIARQKLSPNPIQGSNLDVNLKDFKAVIPGGNEKINDIMQVGGNIPVDDFSKMVPGSHGTLPPIAARIKGATDFIDTISPQKLISGTSFAAKQLKGEGDRAAKMAALQVLKSGGKKLLGAIPVAGGIASALSSGDVMAAAPIPGLESEEAGAGSDTQMASEMDRPGQDGEMTPERMKRLQEHLKQRQFNSLGE